LAAAPWARLERYRPLHRRGATAAGRVSETAQRGLYRLFPTFITRERCCSPSRPRRAYCRYRVGHQQMWNSAMSTSENGGCG